MRVVVAGVLLWAGLIGSAALWLLEKQKSLRNRVRVIHHGKLEGVDSDLRFEDGEMVPYTIVRTSDRSVYSSCTVRGHSDVPFEIGREVCVSEDGTGERFITVV